MLGRSSRSSSLSESSGQQQMVKSSTNMVGEQPHGPCGGAADWMVMSWAVCLAVGFGALRLLLRPGSDSGSSRSKQHHHHQQREVTVPIDPARTPFHSDTNEPKMQSTRFLAANMLRAQPSRMTPLLRTQQATRGFRTVGRQMRPMPVCETSSYPSCAQIRLVNSVLTEP